MYIIISGIYGFHSRRSDMELIDSVFTPITMLVNLIYWRGVRDGAMVVGGIFLAITMISGRRGN